MKYINVYKSISQHFIWKLGPFSPGQAWIDLLLMAARDDTPFGELHYSVSFHAERWQWSKKEVRRFIKLLIHESMLTLEKGARGPYLEVTNFEIYQQK